MDQKTEGNRMITEQLYQHYLDLLLQGERIACGRIVQDLLDREIEIKTLYMDLFQRSLYTVGDLWEANKISVAREHLATAITEGLLNLIYPKLFENNGRRKGKKVVVSCAVEELHQIGGKMVADIFELHGWDGHFLGANTPLDQMLAHIQETQPDLVGLSLSVYFNLPALKNGLEAVRSEFNHLDIFVGGQAFRWGGTDLMKHYSATHYVPSLDALVAHIA
jgi:methanogenic corrinoid protein MtbC1